MPSQVVKVSPLCPTWRASEHHPCPTRAASSADTREHESGEHCARHHRRRHEPRLWCRGLQQTGEISSITLTGGASQSEAVRKIATAVFGLPIVVTDTFESVAVGSARQAAWALTGTLPDWPAPVISKHEPTEADRRAAAEIMERYQAWCSHHPFWRMTLCGPSVVVSRCQPISRQLRTRPQSRTPTTCCTVRSGEHPQMNDSGGRRPARPCWP